MAEAKGQLRVSEAVKKYCQEYDRRCDQRMEIEVDLGEDKCSGAIKGKIAAGPMTFARISTDDTAGCIKAYVGEGIFTDDTVQTPGGIGVCEIADLQRLMDFLCQNGFEHHVAMNRATSAEILEEAFCKYLGWQVYRHTG